MHGNSTNSANYQSNFSTTSSVFSTRVPRNLAIMVITFLATCVLLGALGNVRVCVLFRRRQDRLRNVQHYFLGSLALTGVLSSLINAPSLIVMTVVNYFQIRELSVADSICRVGFPSGFAFNVLNALTLWLMAFDRQDCVLRPFKRRLTTSNVKKIIPVIWMLPLVTAILFHVAIRDELSVCVKFFPYDTYLAERSRSVFTLTLIVAQLDNITVLIIVVTFFRIMKKLRSSAVNPSLNSTSQRQEKALTSLTFKIGGVFLLCRVPVKIYLLVSRAGGFQETTIKSTYLVSIALIHLMYVANPFIHRKVLKLRSLNQEGSADRQAVEPGEIMISWQRKLNTPPTLNRE